ncbi:ATP-binding protein [Kamptonema cortianum]|nr:ATP-binding protein [Geitlerinema splendidum]MDK3156160.1 ATP-binding protein [Kamptonema cortianum]
MDGRKFNLVMGCSALLTCLVALLVPEFRLASAVIFTLLLFASAWVNISIHNELAKAPAELESSQLQISELSREVKRHRDALDDLADGLDILILLTDQRMMVVYANSRATEVFGGAPLVGQSLVAATVSTELSDLVQRAMQLKTSVRAEVTLKKPQERTFLAHAWIESSGEGRAFLALNDVTDIRRLERVRRDFVANVSHELRTPMTTIRAMAETLADGGDSREFQEKYLEKIIREVDRLTSITDDLLTLSVAESGGVTKSEVDAAEIVKGVVLQLQSKAEQKGLDLRYSGAQSALASLNENQFSQIVLNLVDNAINYTSAGEVIVSTELEGGELLFRVTDTGIGISSEHLPRIFERFYRVDKGRSRATGGTGLGLSIVRHLAEAHGGRVSVESELNKGSAFTVTLPVS